METNNKNQFLMEEITERIRKNLKEILFVDSDPVIEQVFVHKHPCSTIVKLRVITDSKEMNLFVKTYRFPELKTGMEKMSREYSVLTLLNERRKELSLDCPVITPLACFQDLQTIITEEHPGEDLSKVLKRGITLLARFSNPSIIKNIENYCMLCGKWLSSFQDMAEEINGRPYVHIDSIADIRSNLKICVERGLINKNQSDLLADFVDRLLSLTTSDFPLSGMHSDFIPSNLLINKDKVVALDFADFRIGPIYRDSITFLHALDNYLWNPLVSTKTIRSFQEHFLMGYGKKVRIQDVFLVVTLEIRQILGEMVNLSSTIRRRWSSSVAYKRAKQLLVSRLLDVVKNANEKNSPYHICGITWDIQP